MTADKIFGYFDAYGQTVPTYDPGLLVNCPVCGELLSAPLRTISLMVPRDTRSYFYRIHRACANPSVQSDIEGVFVDAIYKTWELN